MLAQTIKGIAHRIEDGWLIVVVCPFCGRIHHHGGGHGEFPDGGHRHSHCNNSESKAGYTIEIEIAKGTVTI